MWALLVTSLFLYLATLKVGYEYCPMQQNMFIGKCGMLYSCSQTDEEACECSDWYSVNQSFTTDANDADYVLQYGLRTKNLKNGTDIAYVQYGCGGTGEEMEWRVLAEYSGEVGASCESAPRECIYSYKLPTDCDNVEQIAVRFVLQTDNADDSEVMFSDVLLSANNSLYLFEAPTHDEEQGTPSPVAGDVPTSAPTLSDLSGMPTQDDGDASASSRLSQVGIGFSFLMVIASCLI